MRAHFTFLKSKKYLITFLTLFVSLNILDVYTTWASLSLGAVETNPVLSHYNTRGINWLDLLGKFAGCFTICALVFWLYERGSKRPAYASILILNALYLLIVLTNVRCMVSLLGAS